MPPPTKVDHVASPEEERDLQATTFRLLDLPPEVRHAIYECCLVDVSDDDPHQIHELRSRGQPPKPLRLVCHQINEELTLLFFRTATFKVDSKRGPQIFGAPHLNHSAFFEDLFLRILPGHKMRNIRKLSYNANIEARFLAGSMSDAVDFDGLRDFANILSKYGNALECLHQVRLYAELRKVLPRGPGCHDLMDDLTAYSANPLSSKHTAVYAWDAMDHSKHWESIESKLCGGVLKGWNVSRKVSLMTFAVVGQPLFTFVTAVSVTFYKPVVAPQDVTDCHTVCHTESVVETRVGMLVSSESNASNAVSTWATKQRRPIDGV
ncbi:hypothetical protein LTR20_002344 [Exophiala xenobiotica]|nr:hypothetical protein LTS13_009576 [Exophiala xenobiotica]KAK5400627.1 hypothetical protein LTR79_002729 [Exophiala xenobiotica]KAK5420932.1 hypothetical protein LTR90_003826 [Exophiala xenobiotica]KAK5469833.1 hypothetical protein LTR20_002344 [Exophiala xenobiotica]KAK5477197.1 hypothetical protein LTR26_008331 [Exophiala xenobiotica]